MIKGTAAAGTTVSIYDNAYCTGTPNATGTPADFAGPGLPATVPSDYDHGLQRSHRAERSAVGGLLEHVDLRRGLDGSEGAASDQHRPDHARRQHHSEGDRRPGRGRLDGQALYTQRHLHRQLRLGTGTAADLHVDRNPDHDPAAGRRRTRSSTRPRPTWPATPRPARRPCALGGFTVYFVEGDGPPDTSITGGPAARLVDQRQHADVHVHSPTSNATSFECRVDGGTFTTCTSPFTTATLSDASHTFEVRGVNPFGTDPTPASRTFTVDTARSGHDDHVAARRARRPTTRRRSRSPRPRAARRSSAVSTQIHSRPAPAPFTTAALSDGRAHLRGARHRRRPATRTPTPASESFTVTSGGTPPTSADLITTGPASPTNDNDAERDRQLRRGRHQRLDLHQRDLHRLAGGDRDQGGLRGRRPDDLDAVAGRDASRSTPRHQRQRHVDLLDGCRRLAQLHARHDGARTRRSRPRRRDHQRQHADVHVHLDRGWRDVRVPRRRGCVRGLHQPVHDGGAARRPAHVRRASQGRGRQHRRDARDRRAFTVDTSTPPTNDSKITGKT